MRYSTDQILTSIKLRSMVPVSQQTFQDADLVMLLNEEFQLNLVPTMLSVRQDYFLDFSRVSMVANQTRYAMPERAIGNALKDVYLVENNVRRKLVHTDVGILSDSVITVGSPVYFYTAGDEIAPWPTPAVSGTSIEYWYFRRPNQLVLQENAVQITAVSSVGGTTTFTFAANTTFTDQVAVNTDIDTISNTSPFLVWNQDVNVTAVTGTTIDVLTADVTGDGGSVEPRVGDWLCLAQQSIYPQVPQELHPILAQMVSARIMEALGHGDKLKMVMEKLMMMLKQSFTMIANRIEAQPATILNRNGFLSNTGYGWPGATFR